VLESFVTWFFEDLPRSLVISASLFLVTLVLLDRWSKTRLSVRERRRLQEAAHRAALDKQYSDIWND